MCYRTQMTHPNLQDSLSKSLDAAIQNLFNNLISNLISPTYSQPNDPPIAKFERGFKVALEAYDQALAVIQKQTP